MSTHRSLVLGTLTLVVIAGLGALGAARMMHSVTSYRSPLHANPPSASPPLGSPLSSKVVIVLIDGLRLDTSLKPSLMPTLNDLRQKGAAATMHSQPPSFSQPGYATLLTGAWPYLNDSSPVNSYFSSQRTFTQDDLFSAADRAGLQTAIAGYFWFEKMVPQEAVDTSFYTQGTDAAADVEVMRAVPAMLIGDYSLVLIHLDQVDDAGHRLGGPLSPAADAAVKKVDGYLSDIVSLLNLNQSTLIVLSDHGHIDKGGHGGPEAVTLTEPFVMAGAGVNPGTYPDIQQVDVAPTVASLLGTNIPASAQGKVLEGMVDVSAEALIQLQGALTTQKAALFDAYARVLKQPARTDPNPTDSQGYLRAMENLRSTKLTGERIWRSIVAAVLGLLPALILIIRKQKKFIWLAVGALLYGLIFNFKYAILDGHTYSLSWVESEAGFLGDLAFTSAIALVIAWIVTMGPMEAFQKSPRRAARASLALIHMIIYWLALPVLVSFAVNGLLTTWTLPEFYTIFIALLSLVQIIFVVIFGLLLTGAMALIRRLTPHSRYSTE